MTSAIAKIDKLQFRDVIDDGERNGRNRARGEKNLIVSFFTAEILLFQVRFIP
jgi:hypothetical protein